MAERKTIAPDVLFPRRLAARALGMVLDQYQLGGMTLKLNPDDPSQALPGAGPGEIEFFEDYAGGRGEVLAVVVLELAAGRARVLVERIERLVRMNHRKDFRPREVGIVRRAGAPDIDAVVDVREVLQAEGQRMRSAPQRPVVPPEQRRARPYGIRAFGSSR